MFVSNLPIELQSKKVIEDICDRYDKPDECSVSPFPGLRSYIDHRFRDYKGSPTRLLKELADYDLDVQRPGDDYDDEDDDDDTPKGTYKPRGSRSISAAYDPIENPEVMYIRRFEDLDFSWIEHRVRDLVVGLVDVWAKNSVREFNKDNREQYAIQDMESDKVLNESDLVRIQYNKVDEQRARDKLPFYLKKVYEKGKQLGVHAISLIRADERAQVTVRVENAYKAYTSQKSKRHLIREDVYLQNKDGTLRHIVTSDENSKEFDRAFNWVSGTLADDNSFMYIQEFVECLKVLGVDIKEEDPLIYTEEFINSVCCTYVTSNKEYVSGKYNYNSRVYSELQTISLDNCFCRATEDEEMTEEMIISNLIQKWDDYDKIVKDVINPKVLKELFHWYEVVTGLHIDISKCVSERAFFSHKRGIPLVLDVSRLSNMRFEKAIINTSGVLVAVTDSDVLCILDAYTCIGYLKQFLDLQPMEKSLGAWRVLP